MRIVAIAVLALSARAQPDRGVQPSRASLPLSDGRLFALCIGINEYSSLPKLTTALADAQSVANALRDDFGFSVEVLPNPYRSGILSALNRYRRVLGANDSLLIYYAGHGHSDDQTQRAYWLPADAQPDDTTNWIIADDITTSVKLMEARHVLIISDSCYSGKLARAASVNLSAGTADRARFLTNIQNRRSRMLLSSGGNEPVSDGGGDGTHSIFATVFLQSLRDMSLDTFTVDELLNGYIRERVAGRSSQVPEVNALRDSGHDAGTFVFKRKHQSADRPSNNTNLPGAVTSSTRANVPLVGDHKVNPKDGLTYVWIPPGTFTMGCSSVLNDCHNREKPPHAITISKGFWIGQTEVTQAAYVQVRMSNPSHFKDPSLPVESITWAEARAYCAAAAMRLPTEAEWEYAARDARLSNMDIVAWHGGNSEKKTHEVGRKQSNGNGLYDMLGNVWEWTADWYDENYYASSPVSDPQGASSGTYRAVRGGSWFNPVKEIRTSNRIWMRPDERSASIGVRCVGN